MSYNISSAFDIHVGIFTFSEKVNHKHYPIAVHNSMNLPPCTQSNLVQCFTVMLAIG